MLKNVSEFAIDALVAVNSIEQAVQELVHNSLDAKCTLVSVSLSWNPQKALVIQVSDDGLGISHSNLVLIASIHASVKANHHNESSSTLPTGYYGMNGRALYSLAKIAAHLEIISRSNDNGLGTFKKVLKNGQSSIEYLNGIHPLSLKYTGTTVIVTDLFYQTPLRRSNEKSIQGTIKHIQKMLKITSLCHHDIKFSLLVDGKTELAIQSCSSLFARYCNNFSVASPSMMARKRDIIMINSERAPTNFQVTGFIWPISKSIENNATDFLFINRHNCPTNPLKAFASKIIGRFLSKHNFESFTFVLMIAVEPHLCDFRLNPKKNLACLQNMGEIESFIRQTLSENLYLWGAPSEANSAKRLVKMQHLETRLGSRPQNDNGDSMPLSCCNEICHPRISSGKPVFPFKYLASSGKKGFGSKTVTLTKNTIESLEFIGQIEKTFIICSGIVGDAKKKGDAILVVLDPHACSERIMLERLTQRYRQECLNQIETNMACQQICIPASYSNTIEEYSHLLSRHGMHLEILWKHPKYQSCLKTKAEIIVSVKCLKMLLNDTAKLDLRGIVLKTLSFGKLLESTHVIPQGIQEALNSIACRSAIMFGSEIDATSAKVLVNELLECQFPFQCAHGRPSVVPLLA